MTGDPSILSRKPKGAFVVCSDANWLWQSAFVLQQAIDSDPAGVLDYYYFTTFDTATSPLAHLLDPRVRVVNAQEQLDQIQYIRDSHVPKATFLRLVALDQLSANYDQIVYADGDVFLSWGSWTDLFGLPGHSRAVAAVLGRSTWFNHKGARYGRKYRKALCARMRDRYLNAGVLLVNSGRFRDEGISAKSIAFFLNHPDLCQQSDQSAINAVLEGDWDELSPSWNWQASTFNYPVLSRLGPRVVHFTGPIKPWNDGNGLYRPALAAMARFLDDRGALALRAEVEARCTRNEAPTRQRIRFQSKWRDDGETKFAMIRRYLDRQDFIDVEAGLAPFGDTWSGLAAAPAPAPDAGRHGEA
ncbi:MAG: hypothetical protein C0524_14350 [Rhodobacter sp.]|nr:hypothetical protein [Rhodobacter sp.]